MKAIRVIALNESIRPLSMSSVSMVRLGSMVSRRNVRIVSPRGPMSSIPLSGSLERGKDRPQALGLSQVQDDTMALAALREELNAGCGAQLGAGFAVGR